MKSLLIYVYDSLLVGQLNLSEKLSDNNNGSIVFDNAAQRIECRGEIEFLLLAKSLNPFRVRLVTAEGMTASCDIIINHLTYEDHKGHRDLSFSIIGRIDTCD